MKPQVGFGGNLLRVPLSWLGRRVKAVAWPVTMVLAMGLVVWSMPAVAVAEADATQVTWSLAPVNGDWGTGRANFSYLAEPGAVIEDAVVVKNGSDKAIDLRVYAVDAMNTADGQIDLAPAAATPEDVGAWISLTDPELAGGLLHLEPNQSVTVNFAVNVPEGARPGDHAGGLVTSLVRENAGSTLGVDSRLALRTYVTVTGLLTPKLELADLQLKTQTAANPLSGGRAVVTYTLINTGNARLVPTEVVTVKGPFGMAERMTAQTLEEVLPGGRVQREVVVGGVMSLFRVTATVQVDALAVGLGAEGQPAAAAGQVKGWSVPWVWLVVLVVLLGVTVWAGRRYGQRGPDPAVIDQGLDAE